MSEKASGQHEAIANIEKLTGVAKILGEIRQPSPGKRAGKLPKNVFGPGWTLIGSEMKVLLPSKRRIIGWDDFDLGHLDTVLDTMQSLVDLTRTRVPKKVGKAAWRLVRQQIRAARDASDTDYLESVLGRAETLGEILAERSKSGQHERGAIPKTLARSLHGAIAAQVTRLDVGPGPKALPLDGFVDMSKLGGVLEVAQLLSDVTGRRPPPKVAEAGWKLVHWQVQGIAPQDSPTASNDPGEPRHPGANHPAFAATG